MRTEDELILLCARAAPDESAIAQIKAAANSSLDWDYVYQTSQSHGVAPRVYRNLNSICPYVPEATLDALRSFFFSNAQYNLLLARELLSLVKLFDTNQISAIPFKGPLLAIQAYGDISLRQIADVDLIVHPRDVLRVKELMFKEGFRLAHPMDRAQEGIFLRANCEFTFVRDHPALAVDVHWDIAPKYFYTPFDLEQIWRRLVPVMLAGTKILTLAPEDLLLVLCVHGARHVWERLDWICGVAELLRTHPELEWDRLIKYAQESGAERMLLLGLNLAEKLLAANLPSGIKDRIRADGAVSFLTERICGQLFRETKRDRRIFNDLFVDELHPQMFAHWRDRMRYYSYLFFIPTVGDTAFVRLPRFLSFCYYVIRPIRLLATFGPRLLGRGLVFA